VDEQITAAKTGPPDAAKDPKREQVTTSKSDEQELDAALDAALDAQLAEFNHQMDELLERLDQANKRIASPPEQP
jgi:hypothetical protein